MGHWHSIGVIGKLPALQESVATCQELLRLSHLWPSVFRFETQLGALLGLPEASCCTIETLVQQSDLILVVGGDGSMLHVAKYAVQYDKPVLGINRGQLGFLTDIAPSELGQRLDKVIRGDFWIESRLLLSGVVQRGQTLQAEALALNDVVLSLGASSQLIEFNLWVNDHFVCRQRADGLIMATPTGSTAYALSAGGPIIHPELNAITIVPMLPHKLSSRPIVISGDATIKIMLTSAHENPARVSFDSHVQESLVENDMLFITCSAKKFKLVHPNDYDYFQTLRDKLRWENY
jgi:NAD+ kinase